MEFIIILGLKKRGILTIFFINKLLRMYYNIRQSNLRKLIYYFSFVIFRYKTLNI